MATLLAAPTVHQNGTSKTSLLSQFTEAHTALDNAQALLMDAMPHDRDYYVQKNPEAGETARAQMRKRIELLEAMKQEMALMYYAVEMNELPTEPGPLSPWRR